MNTPLLIPSANIANKNPVFLTGPALSDTAVWLASANKEYLTIPSNASLQTGDISYEFADWLRFDSVGTVDWVVGKDGEWKIDLASNILRFGTYASGTWTYIPASTFGALSTATWYFVRVWRDATAGTINISVNNGAANSASADANTAGANPLVFGKGTGYYNGRMDSAYWTKTLSTAGYATTLYNSGLGFTSTLAQQYLATFWSTLISWWDFNSESGTQYDSKGTNHLTATADPIIAPPVYGNELIVNGGFESDFTGWTVSNGDGTTAITTTAGELHGGSKAAKITGGATPAGTPLVYKTFSVTAGASYYYSFWSRGDGANAGRFNVFDATNSAEIVSVASTNNPTTTYKLFTGQFTAPAGCTTAFISCRTPNAVGGIAYFDDVSVKQIVTPSINNGGFDLRPATGGEKTNVSTVSRARTSNVATMVATAHGLKNNDVVTITGMTDTTFNGTSKTVTVVDVDTFTYSSTGSDAVSAGDTGGRIATDVFSNLIETPSGTGRIIADANTPYSGSYALKLESTGTVEIAEFSGYQILAGKSYSISAFAKANVAVSGISGLYMGLNSASNGVINLSTSYAPVTLNVTNTDSNSTLRIAVSYGTVAYIDQVTLTSLGPTAEAGIAAGTATDGNFAARFTGSSAMYLSRASNASLQGTTSNWGVGCWVMLNSKSTQQVLIAKGTSLTTAANLEYALYYDNVTDKFKWSISDGTNIITATSTATGPTLGNWYYVQGYRSDTGVIGIRVNNGTADTVATALNSQVANGGFAIGNISAGALAVNGRIDAGYKMNRLFTSGELASLYNGGKGLKYAGLPTSITTDGLLMGYWNLDEKSGNYADSSTSANTLTNNGTVTQVQGVNYFEGSVSRLQDLTANLSHFNQVTLAKRPVYDSLTLRGSLLFDGVDDGLVKTGDKIGTGDVTVTAVIKPRGWGGGGAGRIIDNSKALVWLIDAKVVSSSDVGVTTITSANNSIALNTSYVIVITRTSAGVANIYINGVLSGTANQNSGTPVAGSDTYIGNRAAGDRGFAGYIGKIGVINRILSIGEIMAMSRWLSVQSGGIY